MSDVPDLTLNFTGLCRFVPKWDIHDKNYWKQNQMRVLLVDARAADYVHEPVLVCRFDDLVDGGRSPDLITYKQGTEDLAIFYLANQDVAIADASPDSLDVVNSGTATYCPVAAKNESDFDWVAPLEKISPGSGAHDDTCLNDPLKYVYDKVSARVAL